MHQNVEIWRVGEQGVTLQKLKNHYQIEYTEKP